MCICRKTFGWQKRKDKISLQQISDITGLGKTEIKNSLKKLEKLNLIICKKSAGIVTEFELKIGTRTESVYQEETIPGQKVSPPQTESVPVEGETRTESVPTKESNIKKLYKRKIRKLPQNIEEVKLYAKEHKITNIDIDFFWKYFTESGWIDSNGKKVYNWKQKFLTWSRMNFNKEKPFGKVIEK